MTRQILYTGLAGLICLVSQLMDSGIGQAYNLSGICMYLCLGLYLLFPLGHVLRFGFARRREFFLTLALIAVIVVWPATQGYTMQGFQYGWLLTVAYVFGQFRLSENDIRAIGFGAGMMGLTIVAARLLLGIFGDWNENNIAMAGFMGCAVFSAAPWRTWGQKIFHKILLVVMTLMVLTLDSRSSMVGCVILVAFAFGILKPEAFLNKQWLRRLVLVLPALIAVATVLFQNSVVFESLNNWSMEYFNKPIFNGRNTIWEQGLQRLMDRPWLGCGRIDNGHWHNCAITVLTAFGIVGYGVWVCYFENIMVDAQRWRKDKSLALCIAAFLTIMVQQSFELGLVGTKGSMVPYLILGVMLGRMRRLRENEE